MAGRTREPTKNGTVRAGHGAALNVYDLIQQAAFTWIAREKANTQSLPGQIAVHEEVLRRGLQGQGEVRQECSMIAMLKG